MLIPLVHVLECCLDNFLLKLQIGACTTDEQLRSLLCEDSIVEILLMLGYRGVTSKETLTSAAEIQTYQTTSVFALLALQYNIKFNIRLVLYKGNLSVKL